MSTELIAIYALAALCAATGAVALARYHRRLERERAQRRVETQLDLDLCTRYRRELAGCICASDVWAVVWCMVRAEAAGLLSPAACRELAETAVRRLDTLDPFGVVRPPPSWTAAHGGGAR